MIPYVEWTSIAIGPLTLHVWGLFVGLGFLFGALAAGWMAKRRGDDAKILYDLSAWMVFAGMVGGRLGHVLFYDFPYYAAHPLKTFAVWEGGLSMFGGLIACAAVGVWYLRSRQVNVWRYVDSAVFGLPVGMAIGRLGCFFVHDHPGTATSFFLGVQYPDGVVRHDHGLYESINGALLAAVFAFMAWRRVYPLWFLVVFAVEYGVFRLVMDSWRTVDTRYFGLTPGQYSGLALLLAGGSLAVWITRNGRAKKLIEL